MDSKPLIARVPSLPSSQSRSRQCLRGMVAIMLAGALGVSMVAMRFATSADISDIALAPRVAPLTRCRTVAHAGVSSSSSRRGFVSGLALGIPAAITLSIPRDSGAAGSFKFPGDKPKDLGVRSDGGLKGCSPTTSNCWSTSADDDKHIASSFTFSKDKEAAIADLKDVLMSYPKEGQRINDKDIVDGGGWRLMANDGGYFQLEYESKKFGFIDDVEFNVMEGKVNYRSASRQGDSDFGVNAYRLNFIANGLKKKGWSTPGFPLTTVAQR
mmetsp:Transcript_33137/g.46268  ORF Transcript_33137/g.46268 Transcript_33137/m.46268 type:complete len:270 (+) Transcript_33137:42-851(+)